MTGYARLLLKQRTQPYLPSFAKYHPGSAGGSPATLPWPEARRLFLEDTQRLMSRIQCGHFTRDEVERLVWPRLEV
jgi:hypothetical protein